MLFHFALLQTRCFFFSSCWIFSYSLQTQTHLCSSLSPVFSHVLSASSLDTLALQCFDHSSLPLLSWHSTNAGPHYLSLYWKRGNEFTWNPWLILLNTILFPPTDQAQFILSSTFRLTWKGVWIRPLFCSKQRHGMYRDAILVSGPPWFWFQPPPLFFFFFFWPCHTACGILIPWPRDEIITLGSESSES